MNNYNHVVLQGRLSFEPEVKELASGKKLGKIRLACKSGRGTLFIDVDVWDDNLIGTVKQLKKGEEIKVEGELRSNTWEAPTGEKRTKHVVVAEDLRSVSHEDDNRQKQESFVDEAPF